jgi:hypothetical protein
MGPSLRGNSKEIKQPSKVIVAVVLNLDAALFPAVMESDLSGEAFAQVVLNPGEGRFDLPLRDGGA